MFSIVDYKTTPIKQTLIIMGLISTMSSFFSCSGQPNKDDGKLSEEVKEQLAKSIEDFKDRPIYKKLTREIIDKTSDQNLLQVVLDNLSEKCAADYKKEYATVMSWNKARQAIYLIWLLEAEVNNGGYNQFYVNSSGQFYKYLPDLLKLVGANKFADLTKRANDIYEKANEQITQHQDGTIEGFSKSYDDNPLNKCDDEFYNLYSSENLQQIQIDYIRKHKLEFIDK